MAYGVSIPDLVDFTYNGYTFNPTCKTRVTETPVYADDGRSVKWSKIEIDVSGYITTADSDGAALDLTMRAIRLKLQASAKRLTYAAKGFGLDLKIGGGGPVFDCVGGPHPGKLVWWPLGGAPTGCFGAGFSWSVSTCIPECERANFRPGPGIFSQLVWSPTYETDEAGLVTITTRGVAQIPLPLRDGEIEASADDYVGQIIADAPAGFIRRASRQISEDRSSCTFNIVDKQLEVPYPKDCVFMDMKHRVVQKDSAGVQWDCSFSGSVRLSPTADKFLAWRRFFAIAFARIARTRRIRAGSIMPPRVDFEEDIFKNESRFTIRYRLLGSRLSKIINDSGLWRPISNAQDMPQADQWDAASWSESLRDNAQRWRGVLNAGFDVEQDIVIDVCSGRVNAAVPPAPGVTVPPAEPLVSDADRERSEPVELVESGASGNPTSQRSDNGAEFVDPEASWINWTCEVRRVTDHKQVRHKPLRGTVTYDRLPNPLTDAKTVAGDQAPPTPGWSASVPDITQQVAAPSMILRLTGFGVRAAYRVNAPKLIDFGGVTPVLLYEDIAESQFGLGGGVVAFRTDWDLDYIVPSAPERISVPSNPYIGKDGQ